ncbi:MAG: type II secretion system protein GspN, partial [Myxococcota bacterium]
LGAMLGLPVKGTVTGHVRANLAEERSESTGEIDLTLAGFVLGNGVAKLRFNANAFTRAGLTIPETSFGDVELEAALENGSFNITRLQGRGDDIELDGEGQLQVRNTLGNSTLDAALRIGFAGDFRSENEGLFLALDNVPRVRAAKTPDGDALQFNVRGNIGPRLRFQGAGRAPRPGGE